MQFNSATNRLFLLVAISSLLSITQTKSLDITRGIKLQLFRNVSTGSDLSERGYFIHFASMNFSSETSEIKNDSVSSHSPSYKIKEYNEDGWFIEGILLKLLVFICCAAGVFGLLSICCVVCSWFCSPGGTISIDRSRESRANDFIWCARQNQTFIPRCSDDRSSFEYDESNDLPPAYDDLNLKPQVSCSSPPPPPYTPSFTLPETEVSRRNS